MNEAMQEVIKRLRSGTIKQTAGVLGMSDGSRCCLGVMCDVAVEHGVIPAPLSTASGSLSYKGNIGALPVNARKYFGLNYTDGQYGSNSLAHKNDSGSTFWEIADIIESKPEGLFVDEVTA
jgi:hypothetical protein